jgi:hypothetical protein
VTATTVFANRFPPGARPLAVVAFGLMFAASVSCTSGVRDGSAEPASPPPATRTSGLHGVATNDTDPSRSRYENLLALEEQLHTRIGVFRFYRSIRRPGFPPDDLAVVRHVGAIVVSVTVPRRAGWRSVSTGRWDAELTEWATIFTELAEDGVELYLVALAAEPENGPVTEGTAAEYVDAAQYYVRFLRRAGVPALYVFAPMLYRFEDKMAYWYPGDRFIDVIAPDGYNWAGPQRCDGSVGFAEMFQRVVDEASARGKLWGVSEYGTTHRDSAPEHQASWLREADAFIEEHSNNFAYAAYWYNDARCDWTFHTANAFTAFRELIAG